LHTPEEIAEMIGGCLLQDWNLSSMDGWANQPDKNAKIIDYVHYEAESVKELK
jgi:hypothetical protein